ncbi:OmpA family protein [Flavobacterium aquidurense]|uniref:Flagellar motor protein MotB n=1 Tax=Flavobacterium frigidimaris TaxID=262320 RepID=A0ABX4BUS5_FLAFR|nr:OmpA family protein [Flavobacterium frigidimaris]OXA81665.1 flagellar motor protein MotB [Flavobacterium frigidimaris]SDZ53824.1 OmpA family protein [Flavobacterium aquidurense]
MSKKALYVLGIAITIILGTFLYVKFCCNCSMTTTAIDTEKVPSVAVKDTNLVPFVLNGSGIDYRTNDNLKFLKSSSAVIIPVSDSVTIGIENLKTFLVSNPKQKITITGYATSDETNTTTFENLGLARANDVKNYFVSKGLSGAQFDTKGKIIETWKMNADTLLGPVEYNFDTVDTTAVSNDEWTILKDRINADPLTLHFNTNKTSDNLTGVEKQKVTDIVKYMDHIKDAAILIVGHTDNVGNRDANIVLGQKRAEFSKNYLSKNGIDGTRISLESKGPDEPIGENTTTDGKANNRRTVITIK